MFRRCDVYTHLPSSLASRISRTAGVTLTEWLSLSNLEVSQGVTPVNATGAPAAAGMPIPEELRATGFPLPAPCQMESIRKIILLGQKTSIANPNEGTWWTTSDDELREGIVGCLKFRFHKFKFMGHDANRQRNKPREQRVQSTTVFNGVAFAAGKDAKKGRMNKVGCMRQLAEDAIVPGSRHAIFTTLYLYALMREARYPDN